MPRFLWTQKQDIGPKPRVGHAMAYDSSRERLVLFGGDSLRAALFNDTWEWDGENWTQMADIGPSPRSGHAMAFDSKRGRIVLFGGLSAFAPAEPADHILGDTWEHIEWGAAATPPVAPPPAAPQITLQSFIITPATQ